MFDDQFIDFVAAKKNLNRQGTKVLHSIVEAYALGSLDGDAEAALAFCSLMALICEGKVEGILATDEDWQVKWSLTPEYEEQLKETREYLLEAAKSSGKVVQGPW